MATTILCIGLIAVISVWLAAFLVIRAVSREITHVTELITAIGKKGCPFIAVTEQLKTLQEDVQEVRSFLPRLIALESHKKHTEANQDKAKRILNLGLVKGKL